MTTITVAKELSREKNLLAVPRDTYEEFLAWQKKIKSGREFTPTVTEKKAVIRARKNMRKGKYLTLETLRHAVGDTD